MKIAFTETFILIGFQLIPALAFSQKQDTIYFDNLWQICKKEMASYYRYGTVAVDSFAYYSGKVQDYYVTGVLEMEGSYSKDGYKEGIFSFYYPNGKLEAAGNFTKGLMYGSWSYYYENGAKRAKIYYAGDVNSFIVLDYLDSTGNMLSKDGTGKFKIATYDNLNKQQCTLEGEFKNGKRDGIWTYYLNNDHDSSTNLYEELYDNGKFKKGQYSLSMVNYNMPRIFEDALCFNKFSFTETFVASQLSFADSNLADSIYGNTPDTIGAIRNPEVEAVFSGGKGPWKRFLALNLSNDAWGRDLPAKTKKFSQTVWIEFVVCANGSVCEIKMLNNVLPSIKKEAERVIMLSSGHWRSAIQNGKNVKAFKIQPITFMYDRD